MTDFDTETGEISETVACRLMPAIIAAALSKVKAGVAQLGFDERNEHGKYNYASVDKFYTALRPLMVEAKLDIMVDESDLDVRASDKGSTWAFIKYELWFIHETGVMWGPLRRNIALPVTGPQTFGAAESYIRKAVLRGLFMVPTGERDGDDVAPREDAPPSRPVSRAAPAVAQRSNEADIARAIVARIRTEIRNAAYIEQLNERGIYGPSAKQDEKLIRAQPRGDEVWDDLIKRDVDKRYELTASEETDGPPLLPVA